MKPQILKGTRTGVHEKDGAKGRRAVIVLQFQNIYF